MEEDLVGAESRESKFKRRANKRKKWLMRKGNVSNIGNDWLQADGYRTVVHPDGKRWRYTVVITRDDKPNYSRLSYRTEDEAKLAAFDLISNLLNKL